MSLGTDEIMRQFLRSNTRSRSANEYTLNQNDLSAGAMNMSEQSSNPTLAANPPYSLAPNQNAAAPMTLSQSGSQIMAIHSMYNHALSQNATPGMLLTHSGPSSVYSAAASPARGNTRGFFTTGPNFGGSQQHSNIGAADHHNASAGYTPVAATASDTKKGFLGAADLDLYDPSFSYIPEDGSFYHGNLCQKLENVQDNQLLINGIKQALEEPFPLEGTSYNLHCRSESDFKAKFEVYLALNDSGRDLGVVDDFPADAAAQQKLASELVAAMIYIGDDCIDRDSKTPVHRIMKLAPLEFDFMAWKILLECRDIQNGTLSMPGWGTEWDIQSFPSFKARFESVKLAFRQRKSMVASCFDYVFCKRLVAKPSKEEKTKKSNKDLNTKRAGDLSLAKMVKGGGQQESRHKKKQVARASRTASVATPEGTCDDE